MQQCDGPKEVLIGQSYEYSVTKFSHNPTSADLANVKWSYKVGDGAITKCDPPGVVANNKATVKVKIPKEWAGQHVSIMAYINKPTVDVSVKVAVKQPTIKKETILVVVIQQHIPTEGTKLMFPAQAIREIRQNFSKTEYLTILLYKEKYTDEELDAITNAAISFNKNTRIVHVETLSHFISYVNTRSIDGRYDHRRLVNDKNDLILIDQLKIFSHGHPSKFLFNMIGMDTIDPALEFTKSHRNKIRK